MRVNLSESLIYSWRDFPFNPLLFIIQLDWVGLVLISSLRGGGGGFTEFPLSAESDNYLKKKPIIVLCECNTVRFVIFYIRKKQ